MRPVPDRSSPRADRDLDCEIPGCLTCPLLRATEPEGLRREARRQIGVLVAFSSTLAHRAAVEQRNQANRARRESAS
jgi:hypothetical protein